MKSYESIVKGENIPEPEVPESFKVLLKEMRSLCLNVELEGDDEQAIDMTSDPAFDESDEEDKGILGMLVEDAAKTEKEDEEALNDITSELTDLLAGLDLNAIGATPADAQGEEE